jgi:hypothetical protein
MARSVNICNTESTIKKRLSHFCASPSYKNPDRIPWVGVFVFGLTVTSYGVLQIWNARIQAF